MPLLRNQLQDILQTGLIEKETLFPVLRNIDPKQSSPSPSATYALENFNQLVDKLKKLDNDGSDHKYTIRYLMRDENTLLLAREGRRSVDVPGHKNMSNYCIAAGNLYLSQDFKTVIGISHDSGDFLPSMGSLVFPLRRLLKTNLLDSTTKLTLYYREPSNPNMLTSSIYCSDLRDLVAQLHIPEIQEAEPVDPYGSPVVQKKRSFESVYNQEELASSQHAKIGSYSLFSEHEQTDVDQVATSAVAQNTV